MSHKITGNTQVPAHTCNSEDISFNHDTGAMTEHQTVKPRHCGRHDGPSREELDSWIAAAKREKEAAETEKNNYIKKSGVLDILARETTVVRKAAAILEAIANIHVDIPDNIATQGDNPAATNSAILEALSHINPQDPNSLAVAEFFGLPQALPEYTYATDQEVIDIVDDVYNDYFPND